MQNVIDLLKERGLWDDQLVYFKPKRIQIQHEDSRDLVGVMLTDIPIREYLANINFDYSDKPVFKALLDEFDEFTWGLRIKQTGTITNDWHFLIDFESVVDNYIHTEAVWDPNTGAMISQVIPNPSSSTRLINKHFPLNAIHVNDTKSVYLSEVGRSVMDWEDAITNVSFDYNLENDTIGEVFRCYGLFNFDVEAAKEWRENMTGAHSAEFNPIQGEAYQHIYKTVNNSFVKRMSTDISVGNSAHFNDTIQLNDILNPLQVSYSSFKRDDDLSGIDIFSH